MVVVKSVSAKQISDSRGEKTVFVSVNTNAGRFFSSAPSGKSRGKHEAKPYRKSLEKDIESLKKFSNYFSNDVINDFGDLRRIEDIVEGHVGANSVIALESAVLKALAKEKRKEVWQLINANLSPKTGNFPRLVGNVVGGGKHSSGENGRKPDFQEFLFIPREKPKEAFETMKKRKREANYSLKEKDSLFRGKESDENAWRTSLNEKEIFEILKKLKIPFGVDIAASSFYKRKKYHYQNPQLQRTKEEQLFYISNLIRNFGLFYVEDPFDEEDFESFAKLLGKFPNSLIVGDDLTVTNYKRLEKAIEHKSINAIIVKPNQSGSLVEVSRVCELARKKNIKIVFSHRSGETEESILADLAFGFQADFLKAGITGKEREAKIKKLIKIERKLK